MPNRISFIFITLIFLFCCVPPSFAQDAGMVQDTIDYESKPIILYSGIPKKYEIAEIKVAGTKDYEDYVLIG
ncbi:hypothetical protein EZS27_025006, partial [termite gut metagenome]